MSNRLCVRKTGIENETVCVFVCVCVCERDRVSERWRKRGRERERERDIMRLKERARRSSLTTCGTGVRTHCTYVVIKTKLV